jgi:hypothetical protein
MWHRPELQITWRSEHAPADPSGMAARFEVSRNGTKIEALSETTAETEGLDHVETISDDRCVEAGSPHLVPRRNGYYVTTDRLCVEASSRRPETARLPTCIRSASAEVLLHPGRALLSSSGCANSAANLASAGDDADFVDGHKLVVDDFKAFLGSSFPARHGARTRGTVIMIQQESS